jgi:hypothetical protein
MVEIRVATRGQRPDLIARSLKRGAFRDGKTPGNTADFRHRAFFKDTETKGQKGRQIPIGQCKGNNLARGKLRKRARGRRCDRRASGLPVVDPWRAVAVVARSGLTTPAASVVATRSAAAPPVVIVVIVVIVSIIVTPAVIVILRPRGIGLPDGRDTGRDANAQHHRDHAEKEFVCHRSVLCPIG